MAKDLLELTAYHEAGHAVMAMSLGRSIHRVSILPNQSRLGHCEFRKGSTRPTVDWIEREILIALAGMVAEGKQSGRYCHDSADHDLRYVRKLTLEHQSPRQIERFEKRMLSKVEYLLSDDDMWRAVELIAAELVTQGQISGRTAEHLYSQATQRD